MGWTSREAPTSVEAKRRFYAAEAGLAELAARMPSAMSIAGGEAEISGDDRAAWDALQRAQSEAVLAIRRHPTFEGLGQVERYVLDEAASRVARASM